MKKYSYFLKEVYGYIGIPVEVSENENMISFRIEGDLKHQHYYVDLYGRRCLILQVEGEEERRVWRYDYMSEYIYWYYAYKKIINARV
jgi:hypothetical protein